MEIDEQLKVLGFSRPKTVTGRTSVASLFRSKRCGIYVLHFANGEFYVGQSIKVVSRFAQHRHTHTDIEKISFKSVARKNLNSEEQTVIRQLENSGFRLRNINLVTFSYGITDFDRIMPREEQERWLDDLDFLDLQGERYVDDRLRGLYRKKYERLLTLPHAEDVIRVVREYVRQCVPAVKRGEVTFWACSCLPPVSKRQLYIRINVGGQTTFDAFLFEGKPFFQWYLTRSLTEEVFDFPLDALTDESDPIELEFPDIPDLAVSITTSKMVKGGKDQVFIFTSGAENVLKLLSDEYMLLGIRLFNIGLAQKGPCLWGKNHCLDLADRFVE
jgi:hypothetical protein